MVCSIFALKTEKYGHLIPNKLRMQSPLLLLHPSQKVLIIFLIKLLIIYTVLDFLYYGYVGLVDPKGTYDLSQTLIGRYNFINGITTATTYPVSGLLNLFGYSTYQYDNVVGIKNYSGIRILFPCLGIKMWIAFISLIAAYPTRQKLKVKLGYIVVGIGIIHFCNIIRMSLLTLSSRYYGSEPLHDKIFQRHHDIFNLVVGAVVLIMFYIWVKRYNKPIDV